MRKFLSKLLVASLVITTIPGISINANAEGTDNREADITTGLIGYYDFDDDTLVNKASKTGGTAKLHGGAGIEGGIDFWNVPATGSAVYTESKAGLGKAYQFSGDTDKGRGEGLELDVKTNASFTISAWVNTEQKINFQPIFFSNVDADNYVTAGTNYNDFASGGIVNYKTKWFWLDKNNDPSSTLQDLPVDTWTHIALTFDDSGKAALYYNGEALSRQNITDYKSGTYKDMPVYLGINWWNESFKGLMDEVYIYNRALTAADVAKLHKTGKIPVSDIEKPDKPDDITSNPAGHEIGTEGITIKLHNKTTGTNNWDTPQYLIYSADEPKLDAANYALFATVRSDRYIEDGTASVGKPDWEKNIEPIGGWENFLAKNQEGIDYTVSAIRKENTVFMQIKASDILTYCAAVPVAEGKKSYVSLMGNNCEMSAVSTSAYTEFEIPKELVNVAPDVIDTSVNAFKGPYDCEAFWGFRTNGMEVTTEGIEFEFKSRTKLSGNENWHTPTIISYTNTINNKVPADPEKVPEYNEYAVIRSDAYAWAGAANTGAGLAAWESAGYTFDRVSLPANDDWASWLAANKSDTGVDCKVHAIKDDKKVTITFTNHTITTKTEIPYTGTDKFYISMTGEQCVFGKTLPDPEKPKPLAPYIPDMGTGSGTSSASTPAPVPTFPPEDDENKKDEEKEGIEMDFGAFWSAHLPGIEVTESGTALTYKNETHTSATNNWNAPIIVAYSSDDTKVHEAGYPGYDEYAVIRADSYAWTGAANTGDGRAAWDSAGYTFQTNATEASWTTWLSDNKAGVNGKVQAIKSNGKVYVEFTNGTVTTLTSFPVPDGKKVYISLTGEECKISNIKTARYTGINGVTVEPAASATPAASTEPSATPSASTAPTKEPDNSPAPGNTNAPEDPGTTNVPSEPGNTATPEEPSNTDEPSEPEETEKPKKKTMKLSGIKAKTGTKKVTGTVSVKKATVKVKVGNKDYKKAKVNGKKFTFTVSSKLKKGTKITIKVTKTGYKAVTKTTKVK